MFCHTNAIIAVIDALSNRYAAMCFGTSSSDEWKNESSSSTLLIECCNTEGEIKRFPGWKLSPFINEKVWQINAWTKNTRKASQRLLEKNTNLYRQCIATKPEVDTAHQFDWMNLIENECRLARGQIALFFGRQGCPLKTRRSCQT